MVAREAGVVGAVPEWVREVACEAPELVLKVLPLGVAAVAGGGARLVAGDVGGGVAVVVVVV